jgi:wobble nucleotide-excising tRNase
MQSLSYLSLPKISRERLEILLSKSVVGISSDAERVTCDHIKICLDRGGESWIQKGLNYIKYDACPFCGQNIFKNELIEAYQSYFDAAYLLLKEDNHKFLNEVKELLSEGNLLKLQSLINSNDSLAEFWKGYIRFEYSSMDFVEIQDIWTRMRSKLEEYLKKKEANPIEKIELRSDLLIFFRLYNFISRSADKYNQSIEEINKKIAGKKEQINEGDLRHLELDLEILENKRVRKIPEINTLCNNYIRLINGRQILNELKSQAKSSLNTHASKVFGDYESSINKYLELCGAGFRIEKTKTAYSGGTPSVSYSLSIRNKIVELSPRGSKCTPSFRNTLSEGDKSTLAFIFFLAKLDSDSDISKKLVVFDDPVSSLDDHRRTFTQEQISILSKRCNQMIVLTHDRYLARQIFDNRQIEDVCTLQVKRQGDNSSIIEKWDIEADTLSDYFKNYEMILRYTKEGSSDVNHKYQVVRCIRPLLEGYLRVHFPGDFKRNEWLGNFLEKIRDSKEGDTLYNMKPKYDELDALNNYSKKYHHNQDSGIESGPINESELRTYAKRTLKAIENV